MKGQRQEEGKPNTWTIIQPAQSKTQIRACYPVLKQLRPHLSEETFVDQVQRQQQRGGYHLAAIWVDDRPVAVAGFRLGESLAWGAYLYVDDLVTDASHRSRGYGTQLLSWLAIYGRGKGCTQLHLDSGLERADAHRFYERERMTKAAYHFVLQTGAPNED